MLKANHYFIILHILMTIVDKVQSQPVYIGNDKDSSFNNNNSFVYDIDAMPCSVELVRTAGDPVNEGE